MPRNQAFFAPSLAIQSSPIESKTSVAWYVFIILIPHRRLLQPQSRLDLSSSVLIVTQIHSLCGYGWIHVSGLVREDVSKSWPDPLWRCWWRKDTQKTACKSGKARKKNFVSLPVYIRLRGWGIPKQARNYVIEPVAELSLHVMFAIWHLQVDLHVNASVQLRVEAKSKRSWSRRRHCSCGDWSWSWRRRSWEGFMCVFQLLLEFIQLVVTLGWRETNTGWRTSPGKNLGMYCKAIAFAAAYCASVSTSTRLYLQPRSQQTNEKQWQRRRRVSDRTQMTHRWSSKCISTCRGVRQLLLSQTPCFFKH